MPAPSATYAPRPGTLPERVCNFFRHHPEEELSTRDIAQKFDVPVGSVRAGLDACLTHKLLKLVGSNWMAGLQLQAIPPTSTIAPPQGATKPKRVNRVLPPIDATALQVRTNVALPEVNFGKSPKGRTKYDAVFDKLSKAGMSLELPLTHRAAIASALAAYMKRTGHKFALRTTSPTHCGVWRTA